MKLVIVGAGFAGLRLARKLNGKKGFEVLLIDKYNFHQFQPLLYQVATGGLDPSNIAFPLRKIFQKSPNVRFRLAQVIGVEPETNNLITDSGPVSYDVLILATGATSNFFGNTSLENAAYPMKTVVEALNLRYGILTNLEKATIETNAERKQALLNFVVVGGGATGVELAGALAELKRFILPRDYPEINPAEVHIYLIEGAPVPLNTMQPQSSQKTLNYLTELGVELKLRTLVSRYDPELQLLYLNTGETIPTVNVIWAAGVQGNPIRGLSSPLLTKSQRILVDRQCRIKPFNNIFAVGDVACMPTENYPNGHPQLASVALQQADFVFKLLTRHAASLNSETNNLPVFEYKNRGVMATIGRNRAVVELSHPRLTIGGRLAWFIWMSLHLMLILGVKNKFFVFLNWVYNYVTYDQNLRIILREHKTNTPATTPQT